jgi:REP element-mobilizing transposase RayT
MSSFTQLLYHIVFSTKDRNPVMVSANREELFKYIWGILKNKNCLLYRINGVEDHIHILTHIHQSLAVADVIKDIKVASSIMIKEKALFPGFAGWQVGYGCFTVSLRGKEAVIKYIKNQEAHHAKVSFQDEYRALLHENGVTFDDRYLL